MRVLTEKQKTILRDLSEKSIQETLKKYYNDNTIHLPVEGKNEFHYYYKSSKDYFNDVYPLLQEADILDESAKVFSESSFAVVRNADEKRFQLFQEIPEMNKICDFVFDNAIQEKIANQVKEQFVVPSLRDYVSTTSLLSCSFESTTLAILAYFTSPLQEIPKEALREQIQFSFENELSNQMSYDFRVEELTDKFRVSFSFKDFRENAQAILEACK